MTSPAKALLCKFVRRWGPPIRGDEAIAGSEAVDYLAEFCREARKVLRLPESLQLSKRDLAHLLAALRYQQAAEDGQILFGGFKRMPHFREAGVKPLTSAQVDRLCGRLNS